MSRHVTVFARTLHGWLPELCYC